jgi:hypothetical protein
MSHDDFIEVYENALPREICTSLVQRFDASAEAKRGSTGTAGTSASPGSHSGRPKSWH